MADRQKLIGVCLSQAHHFLNEGFLSELESAAGKEGFRVVVFNSQLDFYWYKKENNVARSVYEIIDYGLFSALVIIYESFHDPQLLRRITEEARRHDTPVFCLGAVQSGCISVVNDYVPAFKQLLNHVIRDHGARDTFFISGIRDEPNSVLRLRCYRDVLEENGIPYLEENTDWGHYWDRPAAQIAERLIQTRNPLPQAVFCANDYMAVAVCDTFRAHGIRVPEDVIVTGFDGIPISYIVHPALSTCSHNPAELANRTVALILQHVNGRPLESVYHHPYLPVFSESCGCRAVENRKLDALTIYRRNEAVNSHENQLYHTVERILMQENMQDLLFILSETLLPNSAVFLNESFVLSEQSSNYETDRLEQNLLMLSFRERNEEMPPLRKVRLSEIPLIFGDGPGITIISSIHSDTTVCGCFAVHTVSLDDDTQLIKRISDVLNLLFTILLGNARQKKLLTHLENSLYLDPQTNLSNLKGLTRWFQNFSGAAENHRSCVAVSVYNIHRYSFIYETYGISETEAIVTLVARALSTSNPAPSVIARIGEDQFVVINYTATHSQLSDLINRSVAHFYSQIEAHNAKGAKPYYVEVNCGCTTMDGGWKDAALENLISLATGEMYLSRLQSGTHVVRKEEVKSSSGMYSSFRLLLEKNLFKFHFQPIVDARTGLIYAYEALMRTDSLIHLTAVEVLQVAREYDRLYEVEKNTLFGIMEKFTRNYGAFHNNRIFINTVSGHFLNDEDCELFFSRYENYLDCVVFELTEQDPTSDEELDRLKRLCKRGGSTRIAIDDFGTGHSNIVNLLRYSPQIIKIDQGLISGIQSDSNKQLFVRNTIEFAHQNGIIALAEGVETSEELRTVIDYGVDLIQGFYTGRPSARPVSAIPDSIRNEIIEENLRIREASGSAQVYTMTSGESVHLIDMSLRHYGILLLPEGEYTLIGEKAHTTDLVVSIADGADVTLTVDNINLKGITSAPVQLGRGSRLTLILKGQNTLNKEGIRVPPDSSLEIVGDGSLIVHNNRNYSVGIGANFNDPYGSVTVDIGGSITFDASGDRLVCIGGGTSAGSGILLKRGNVSVDARGINVVGIGSSVGAASVTMLREASVGIHMQGNDAVCIGTMAGPAVLKLSGSASLECDCERSAVLGTLSGSAEITVEDCHLNTVLRCDIGTCLGTFSGEARIRCAGSDVHIHGEGNRIAGLGSPSGACDTLVESGILSGELLSGTQLMFGNDHSRVVITGGNVQLLPAHSQPPVSPGGSALCCCSPGSASYRHTFREGSHTWTYTAEADAVGRLSVYVPPEAGLSPVSVEEAPNTIKLP